MSNVTFDGQFAREFAELADHVFGSTLARTFTHDLVLEDIGGMTAVQALEHGVAPLSLLVIELAASCLVLALGVAGLGVGAPLSGGGVSSGCRQT